MKVRILFLSLILLSVSVIRIFASDDPKADPELMKKVEAALTGFASESTGMNIADKDDVFSRLRSYLENNDFIYGAAFAFAPVMDGENTFESSPYVFRSGDEFTEVDLSESYETSYTEQQWYFEAANSGKAVWSDPYFDEGGGNVWMVTYSVPVFSAGDNSKLLGIITSDLMIPEKN